MRNVREPWGCLDDPSRLRYPTLLRFLTDRSLPGGKSREVPRLSIAATPKGFKATLTDYTLSMAYDVEFRHFEQLLEALTTGFTANCLGWRPVMVGEAYKARKEIERKQLESNPDEVYNAAKTGGKRPLPTK